MSVPGQNIPRPARAGDLARKLFGSVRSGGTQKIFPSLGRDPADVTARDRPTPPEAQPAAPPTAQATGTYRPDRLPPYVALMKVHQNGEQGLRVDGVHGETSGMKYVSPTGAVGAVPRIGPADLKARRRFDPRGVFLDTSSWSDGKGGLCGWLNELRDHYFTALQLVIFDTTGLEIPWEALRLGPSPSGLDGGRLGATVAVSRWAPLTVHSGTAAETWPQVRHTRSSGGVFGYIAELGDPDPASVSDREVLDEYLVGTALTDGRTFLRKLRTTHPTRDVGLVYASAHGVGAGELPYRRFGTLLLQDAEYERRQLRLNGLIVFFNGCGSARMLLEESYADGVVRGFPEVFLSAGATGFVGSTTEVGSSYAAEVLAKFVREFSKPKAVPVAEFLRRIRHEVDREVDGIRDLPEPTISADPSAAPPGGLYRNTYLRWIDAFSYVYYGNPLATLELDVGAT